MENEVKVKKTKKRKLSSSHKNSTTHELKKSKVSSVSNTILFSMRRSKMSTEKQVEEKRTSFLELFFDLAIIFVFALVASGFAKAWHVDAEQLLGNSHGELVSSIWVSVSYWVVSFMSLWLTWHQYNVYVRYYGRNNLSSHTITFLLIISVIFQGMAKIVSYEWFHIYALLTSYLFSRGVMTAWMWLSIDKNPRDNVEKYRLSILKKQTWAFAGYLLIFIAFIVCTSLDILIPASCIHYVGAEKVVDYIWVYLWVTIFLIISVTFEIAVEFINKHKREDKVNKYESVIFHNKERHHLFLIITFGELLVINLSTGTEFVNLYGTLLPSLAINLVITMIIWYIYKTFVFAPEYKLTYKNRVLFTFLHIIIIGSLTVILSSLETYSIAIHELESGSHGHGYNIGLIDLRVAVDIVYPIIFLSGYIMLILGIVGIVLFSELKSSTFENAIRSSKRVFAYSMLFPVFVGLVMLGLTAGGVIVPWIVIESVLLGTMLISMGISLYAVNKYLLKHNKPDEVVEILEEIHG